MAQAEIDGQKFADLLLAEFPKLRDDADEWNGLVHLQMMTDHLFFLTGFAGGSDSESGKGISWLTPQDSKAG